MGKRAKIRATQCALALVIGLVVIAAGISQFAYQRAFAQAEMFYRMAKLDEIATMGTVARALVKTSLAGMENLARRRDAGDQLRYNLALARLWSGEFEKATAGFRKLARDAKDRRMKAQAHYMAAWSILVEVWRTKPFPFLLDEPHLQALAELREAMRFNPDHRSAKRLYELISRLLGNPPPDGQDQGDDLQPGNVPGGNPEPPQP